jgi:hypothetical protein
MLDLIADETALMTPELVELSAWLGHIPFAFAVVKWHNPTVLVELGTHSGVSYCAFCQAVRACNISCKCYAVDTWTGDEHTGPYGEQVFDELSGYHASRYSHFSQLLKMSFDEALGHFTDRSIDLLHIDGCHLYEAVKHDFESWFPKMSHRGIVLLHDTCVEVRDFGVGQLLHELELEYPSFEFTHSYGLGIVGVGSLIHQEPIWELFQADEKQAMVVKGLFSTLGQRVELLHELRVAKATVEARDAQLAEATRTWGAVGRSHLRRATKPLRMLAKLLRG